MRVRKARFRPAGLLWVAATASLAAAMLWPGAAGEQTEAAGPLVVPACGRGHVGGATLPSALPLRAADAAAPPFVTAAAAVVVDAETGRVLYGLGEHDRRSPASTTKIMTAILALEHVSEDAVVIAQSDGARMSASGSSVMGLVPGTPITMRDLLYGLMLPSGNDAALDIARALDGDVGVFVERMNAKTAELGLENTNFRNPHGLDGRNHYSSAYDLAIMTRYAMANDAFRRIVSTQWHDLSPPFDYGFQNGNSLLQNYAGADGVKIGWTDRAGWTFVASAVRDGRRVFVTVLNSQDRDADAAALLDWAFAAHRWTAPGPVAVAAVRLMERVGIGGAYVRSVTVCG